MDNQTPDIRNEVLNAIVDGAMAKVRTYPHWRDWKVKHDALSDKINGREMNRELFDVVWQGINLYAEEMFKLGWELRANPSGLFELPDDR